MKELPSVKIEERASRRIKAGYPWIFRSELKTKPGVEDGSVVNFLGEHAQFIARGFYNSVPQMAGRVLTRLEGQEINAALIHERLRMARDYRDNLYGAPFYRLVHAESDGFPGLIVDRYGDILVVQCNTAGMQQLYPLIEKALIELLSPKSIVLRNDSTARETEGLSRDVTAAYGDLPAGKIVAIENDTEFLVDVVGGQKTGWFFDQRDNRAHVAALATGKSMIDVFCHTGAFGITALEHGAESVVFVDSSDKALEDAMANAKHNEVDGKCSVIAGKAFDVLEKLGAEKKTFDVVCVDPPAFIKSRKDMAVGMKAYQKLARLSAKLVKRGGFLFFASCSHHADVKELSENVAEGIFKTGRTAQLIRTGCAGADHPVHPLLPETGYLKALTYRFLD